MTPVSGSAAPKALAVLTASWPVIASTTNRVSIGCRAACSLLDLRHHRFVYGEAAGGVDDQHFMVMLARPIQGGEGDSSGFWLAFGREEVDVELLRQCAQLLYGGGAIYIAAYQQYFFLVLVARQFGQFATAGGFTRALQAGHQDHGGRHGGEVECIVVLAHQFGQFAVYHADQRLAGGEAVDDFLSRARLLSPW